MHNRLRCCAGSSALRFRRPGECRCTRTPPLFLCGRPAFGRAQPRRPAAASFSSPSPSEFSPSPDSSPFSFCRSSFTAVLRSRVFLDVLLGLRRHFHAHGRRRCLGVPRSHHVGRVGNLFRRLIGGNDSATAAESSFTSTTSARRELRSRRPRRRRRRALVEPAPVLQPRTLCHVLQAT